MRRKCDRATDGDLCYKQMAWIDEYMNQPQVKRALGVDSALEFASCNSEILQAFAFQGDGAHNRATLLPPLIEDGIRLLVYAGRADMVCNFIVRVFASPRFLRASPYPGVAYADLICRAMSAGWSSWRRNSAASLRSPRRCRG